jgi:hypothetical protein
MKVLKKQLKRKQDEDLTFRRRIKMNEFVLRYTSENMDTESEQYMFWRTHVVPSCVQENSGAKFICVFCSKEISSACGIRRHYREQHYNDMPEGIFGSKIIFECKQCDLKFNRKPHLTNHLQSELHQKSMRLIELQKSVESQLSGKDNKDQQTEDATEKKCTTEKKNKKTEDDLSTESGYFTQDECLKIIAEKSILSLPRSSTRLSSIFEKNETELDEVDDILSNIKHEAFDKFDENAKTKANLSLDNEILHENKTKNGKKLARELSNMLLLNLSFD